MGESVIRAAAAWRPRVHHFPDQLPPCLAARLPPIPFNFVLSAAQSSVKTLKSVLSACFSIILQAGTSSPRASRSRESFIIPSVPSRAGSLNTPHRYNPVLGEFFRCRYDYPNDTQGFFISEQGIKPAPPHPIKLFFQLISPVPLFSRQYRTTHPYPPFSTSRLRTNSASSASSGPNPSFSATPFRRPWRARTA